MGRSIDETEWVHVGNLKGGNRYTGGSLYHPIFVGLKISIGL